MLYINDIIANRKNLKTKQKVQYKFAKHNNNNRMNLQPNFQNMFHLQQYEDSHKEEVISYMENKNLLFFNEKFNRNHIKLLKIQKQQLIQNNYDSLQKSFLLLYGKLKLKPKQIKQAKKDTIQTAQQQYFKVLFQQFKIQDHNNDMIYIIKEQMGIGYLFNSLKYTNIEIYAQNALLLEINHSQNNFQHIIQNHFISHREQQNIIKDIKIFNSIVNFQKIYLHHFVTLKYKKGEIIYQINDQSSQFYLIIQGSVQFQSVILLTQIQNGLNLNKKQDRYKQFSIITQKLNRGGYFGQQEILKKKRRLQNVRCQSFECILLVLPGKIFQKCLQVPQFKNKMSEMADNKQQYRQSIIKNFLSLKDQNKQDHQNQMIMKMSNLQSTHFFKGMSHLNISRTNKNKNIKIIDNNQFQQTNIDNLKEKEFYMLDVNKNMYEHTLKRFRLSMQEIKKRKEPPSKNQQKGRSLQDIWKCLKLSNSIDLNRNKINLRNTSGLKYYNADLKIKAQLKASKSLKPRSLLKEYMPRIDKKDWSTLMICDIK